MRAGGMPHHNPSRDSDDTAAERRAYTWVPRGGSNEQIGWVERFGCCDGDGREVGCASDGLGRGEGGERGTTGSGCCGDDDFCCNRDSTATRGDVRSTGCGASASTSSSRG